MFLNLLRYNNPPTSLPFADRGNIDFSKKILPKRTTFLLLHSGYLEKASDGTSAVCVQRDG